MLQMAAETGEAPASRHKQLNHFLDFRMKLFDVGKRIYHPADFHGEEGFIRFLGMIDIK